VKRFREWRSRGGTSNASSYGRIPFCANQVTEVGVRRAAADDDGLTDQAALARDGPEVAGRRAVDRLTTLRDARARPCLRVGFTSMVHPAVSVPQAAQRSDTRLGSKRHSMSWPRTPQRSRCSDEHAQAATATVRRTIHSSTATAVIRLSVVITLGARAKTSPPG